MQSRTVSPRRGARSAAPRSKRTSRSCQMSGASGAGRRPNSASARKAAAAEAGPAAGGAGAGAPAGSAMMASAARAASVCQPVAFGRQSRVDCAGQSPLALQVLGPGCRSRWLERAPCARRRAGAWIFGSGRLRCTASPPDLVCWQALVPPPGAGPAKLAAPLFRQSNALRVLQCLKNLQSINI
jgi:hypothetical protein